jgi:hypothetical protein
MQYNGWTSMTANDLLDLLLDNDCVGWQITRTDHGLEVVGILPNGAYRLLTIIPTSENQNVSRITNQA